jgi:hypothetical protein
VSLVADAYSDEEMFCPSTYYGSYKEPWLVHVGEWLHALSDPMTGEPVPSTFRFTMWDGPADGEVNNPEGVARLRAQLASTDDRYWRDPLIHYMTSRANRAQEGRPFTTFVGFITGSEPTNPRGWEFTLQDIITRGVLQEDLDVPWRKIGDGFLNLLDAVSEHLDRRQAEPIIYGRHTRTTEAEPSPVAAWPVIPIYLGIQTIGASQKHVWMVAGHACKSVTIRVDGVATSEGSDWLIATQAGWLAEFGAPYVDYESSAYPGVMRRYTLIYGDVDAEDPEACALGEKSLLALVEGTEANGDGSGALITDYYQQYKHFVKNYIANRGHFSYMSGAYLSPPTWEFTGETISIVDETSFDTASTIASAAFGGELQGAAAIGFHNGSAPPTQVIAEWNRSGFVRFGETLQFRMGITRLSPTLAIKEAAPLFTDAYEILKGSFRTDIRWPEQRNAIEFEADYDPETAVWKTIGLSADETEAERYNATPKLSRQYAFLPGLTQCQHIADLEQRTLEHPPRLIALDEAVGDDEATTVDPNRLAYLRPGEYLRYMHFDEIAETRSERLAYIVARGGKGSERAVTAIALDCEDLIGFDEPVEAS